MFSKKLVAPLALVAASVLAFSGCAANEAAAPATTGGATASGLSGRLTGKGASSMSVAQTTWIAAFQTANPDVTVNYSPDGSGAGREAFTSGAAQFAGSDRALKDDEMGAGKFALCTPESNALNLPVYVSPIAIIYKVDGVTDLKLDADTTAKIFAGKITTWNDPAIAALNPGANLPAATITAVHRSDDSGTTENFTDYLAQAAPSVWTEKAAGIWPDAFPGEAAKGTAGVVSAVESGNNTIGYADESQAGSLGKAQVKVGSEFFGPDRRGGRQARRQRDQGLRPRRQRLGAQARPHRRGPVPDRPGLLRHRVRELRGFLRRRSGEVLRRLHRLRRRPEGRAGQGGQRPAVGRHAGEAEDLDRLHQVIPRSA
jgi:phosphate transport system substrate-binding protein